MNKSLMAVVLLLIGTASQALAAGACPSRSPGETIKSFRDRTHDYCEVHWRSLLSIPGGPGQTHDFYINLCSKACYKALGSQGSQSLATQNLGSQFAGNQISLIGGLSSAAAVTSIGVATALNGGGPASP